jgi:hypothetical protein
MTAPNNPEEGLADALGEVGERTRELVRAEVGAIRSETERKLRAAMPAVALLGLAGGCGLLAVAASYRLTLRLFERLMAPGPAAATAMLGYGAVGAAAGLAGASRLRRGPVPFPTETLRRTSDGAAEGVREAAR